MTRRYWTDAEVARLRELYPNMQTREVAARLGVGYQRVVSKAYTLGLYKTVEFLASPLAHRLDGIIGWQTRFRPGQQSWNKGIKGLDIGGRETRFQPGSVPANVQDVGALRITTDGVLQIKLAPGSRQWVMMSHYTWWLHTGKWPRRGREAEGDAGRVLRPGPGQAAAHRRDPPPPGRHAEHGESVTWDAANDDRLTLEQWVCLLTHYASRNFVGNFDDITAQDARRDFIKVAAVAVAAVQAIDRKR